MVLKVCALLTVEALLFAALLFGAAGTALWLAGWVYFALFFGGAITIVILMVRLDSALLAERMKSPVQKEQPLWDKILLPVMFLVVCAWTAVMGCDAVRFHWSRVPAWLQTVGAGSVVVSLWIIARVSLGNTYLAVVVKIQKDRGHRVITTGPYAVVRHPMYAGILIYLLATPLLLGSRYGLAGTALLAGGFVVRTALEDRELHRELEGYAGYATRVRYRLFPGVW